MVEFAKCRDPNCWFQRGKPYVARHCHPVRVAANTHTPIGSTLAQAFNDKQKHLPPTAFVDVVMSGFPDHAPPHFIELDNESGHSIEYGEWIKRADGQHVLRIPLKGN